MKFSFFYFLMLVLVVQGLDVNKCPEKRCGPGLAIRFPFRLRENQPENCGHPGFDLSCIGGKHAQLELPNSLKLYIQRIDYVQQVLDASDPDGCLPNKAKLLSNLSTPGFKVTTGYKNYALFRCPSPRIGLGQPVDCLRGPGFEVYAVDSFDTIDNLPLTSCTKLYNISSVPDDMFETSYIQLSWSSPNCTDCEIQGKRCGWKNGSRSTTCFENWPKRSMGILTRVRIAGIVLSSLLVVLVSAALCYVYNINRKEKENQKKVETFLEDYKALKPTRYSYADLKSITNQFKDKLGQGAYGIVFKGKLSSEIFVAVKILNSSTGNGEEFINEVGTMGRIHHVNVVRLVGFCADGFRRALVYEFLPNESLEKFIFSDDGNNRPFGWEKLEDIALGIAKGIEYLHQGCDQRILHFDIKPHNILLDDNFTPKIADFGLAKLCSKDQSAVSMTAARGTMGYIAPEVFSRNFGKVSYKSDVYSFGMLLLEMVGGRKNIDVTVEKTSQVFFPEWIYNHLDQGEELRIRIEEEGDAKTAKKLTVVGLWCIQWYPADRPSMKEVVQMLEGEDDLSMPRNPFASAGPMNANAGMRGRQLHQELEVISEVE